MLCLKSNSRACRITNAKLAFEILIEEVACVHLCCRFGSEHLHNDACDRRHYSKSDLTQIARMIECEAVVIAVAVLELLVVGIYVLAYGFGVRKSKGVPVTSINEPSVISVSSAGVMRSASTVSTWL